MRPDPGRIEQLLTAATERARGIRVHMRSTMEGASGEDAVLQARLFSEILADLEVVAKQLQSARLDAVSSLREQGYSYEELAQVLGVSKARAQQLVAAARRRGGASPEEEQQQE